MAHTCSNDRTSTHAPLGLSFFNCNLIRRRCLRKNANPRPHCPDGHTRLVLWYCGEEKNVIPGIVRAQAYAKNRDEMHRHDIASGQPQSLATSRTNPNRRRQSRTSPSPSTWLLLPCPHVSELREGLVSNHVRALSLPVSVCCG